MQSVPIRKISSHWQRPFHVSFLDIPGLFGVRRLPDGSLVPERDRVSVQRQAQLPQQGNKEICNGQPAALHRAFPCPAGKFQPLTHQQSCLSCGWATYGMITKSTSCGVVSPLLNPAIIIAASVIDLIDCASQFSPREQRCERATAALFYILYTSEMQRVL
jgi:hypothetical protein